MGGDEVIALGTEKFNDTDFAYLRMQIDDYLYEKKLHLPLLGKRPEKMDEAELNMLDRQDLGNRKNKENDDANIVIEEIQDALLLTVHSFVDDWILDSGVSFHTPAVDVKLCCR
ncbi:uncharacterized protein LOC110037082 [Phalaenopsis equestris]|uniref:uncharacterized protein LOC110037082 n=1 Tax=Phalaenopsis equestris TaxID=78828 RepID=UPI0009E28B8C|nr:uncharacterized protein LOC110037082 [Phalaenopsis equestris]